MRGRILLKNPLNLGDSMHTNMNIINLYINNDMSLYD